MAGTSARILRKEDRSAIEPVPWHCQSGPTPQAILRPAAAANRVLATGRDLAIESSAEEAYQRGYAEGKQSSADQAAAEVQVVLDRLARNLAELSTFRSRIRKDAEADLLKLSIAIARRVLHRELTLDAESIDGLIRVALQKLDSHELCRVRIHPDHEHAVRSAMARFAGAQRVEILADPSLRCGDVLFETSQGSLDASIETQLREIERGFADRLRR